VLWYRREEVKMNKRYVLVAFALLVFAALACNRTVATPTPQAETPTPTASLEESTPTVSTAEPPSTMTPSPTGLTPTAGTPECIFDADFVTDVTIPDDTELKPGTEFAKTWRMRNSGTCAWEAGTMWAFESGDKLGGPDSVSVPATESGNTVDITVNLTAPATPGTYTGYWRMRRPNGEIFGVRSYVRIVVTSGQVTATPSATPTPTPTSRPGVGPVIDYFRSDVQEANPGDTLTLEWETQRANSAILYHLMPTGQLGSFWEVGVNGVFEYEIDGSERNHTDFLLIVTDDAGRTAQASLTVVLRCPDSWFFTPAPDECPASSAIVSVAAEENFEHGIMIWVNEQDLIYVLFDDGRSPRWSAYADEWEEGDPEDDPTLTPPTGRYQPVRGFGLVWREQPGVRDRLGWAVNAEIGFTTSVQRTSRPKYNDTYIRALDGGVWKLLPESSGWEKLP
jgi:hypothetical protein